MAMTQVSLYFNMCRYAQTVMCAVKSVRSADKRRASDRESEREWENWFADTNIQNTKGGVTDLLPLPDLKIQYFRASPGKCKTIIPNHCRSSFSFSFSPLPSFFFPLIHPPSLWSTFEPLLRQIHLHICIALFSSSCSSPPGLQTSQWLPVCRTVEKRNLRLVYKSLNDSGPKIHRWDACTIWHY